MPDVHDQTSVSAISERLARVRERIEDACERSGRDADAITLVAVSKTFPMDAIEAAQECGLEHFGENRARQLRDKAKDHPGRVNGGDLTWRMIGHLQTNKAKFVARHADWFDALDSPRLAKELNKRAGYNDRTIPCLLQVNITEQDRKYGVMPDAVHMGTFIEDPGDRETVRDEFRRMRDLFDTYDASGNPQVEMETLSLGMSGDFEIAIEEGSTMLRLGSALFGPRDYD